MIYRCQDFAEFAVDLIEWILWSERVYIEVNDRTEQSPFDQRCSKYCERLVVTFPG